MFTYYRSQGFVLKKENRGEADQLLTIFTKDFGRVKLLARSIRKIKSKLRSSIELFYLSEIEFVQGKTYNTLIGARLLDKFPQIRQNLEALAITYKIAQIFDKLIKGQEKDENLWQLLEQTFKKLDRQGLSQESLEQLYKHFLWQFLILLGYDPEMLIKQADFNLIY